jgi:hypothetical protein
MLETKQFGLLLSSVVNEWRVAVIAGPIRPPSAKLERILFLPSERDSISG